MTLAARWLLVVGSSWAVGAWAQPDAEFDDAKQFLAGRPELQTLVGKAATKDAPGLVRLDLGTPEPRAFLVKTGSGWVAALLASKTLDLAALLPASLVGQASPRAVLVVVSGGAGTLGAAGPLSGTVTGLGRDVAFVAGVNVFSQLDVGPEGTLGAMQRAGVIPSGPMWLSGTTGGSLAEALTTGTRPDLSAIDLSLKVQTNRFVPAPFTALTSPKLTLGEATITVTRKGGAVSVSGEQLGSTLALGDQTFSLPRTSLTFTQAGASWDVRVEGASAGKPWRNAFGLKDATLDRVALVGTVSSTPQGNAAPPIRGFGLGLSASVSLNKKSYDGQLLVVVENNALKELTVAMSGELSLGFVGAAGRDFTFKRWGLSVAPASQQASLFGALAWRDLSGTAALVFAPQPTLFLKLSQLDLASLRPKGSSTPAGLPTLPPLDALLTLGFGANAQETANLPQVAQDLIDEVTGVTNGRVKVGTGLSLVTQVDGAALGADAYGTKGKVLLAGSLDVATGAFRLATSLPSVPKIPGLPQGFSVDQPEFFVAVSSKGGATVGSFGLGLRLVLPIDGQSLAFRGAMAGSSAGTFSFTGTLETNWVNPVGLNGLTVLAPVAVTVGVGADGSVDLGFQGGLGIAKQTYSPLALCLNVQPAAPTPVPKKVALRFKGTEFGPQAQMDVMEALVKSVASGPLSKGADAPTKQALAQVGPAVEQISDTVDGLNLPLLSFTQVDVALTTPGVTCELPAIVGVGVAVKGTARLMGQELGALDSSVNLTQGLVIKGSVKDVVFLELVKLTNAKLNVVAPMPGASVPPDDAAVARADKLKVRQAALKKQLTATTKALKKAKGDTKDELEDEQRELESDLAALDKAIAKANAPDVGSFVLSGRADVLRAKGNVRIAIDRTGAGFDLSTELATLGAVTLRAETDGDDLTKAKDFALRLEASNSADDVLLAQLATALKATAAARKQAQAALSGDDALKKAKADFEKLDDSVGKDLRKAKKDLKSAKRKLKKAERAIDRAKDKCKDDLGPLYKLCDTLDAAKATLKGARKTVDAAKTSVAALKKSSQYANYAAAKATLETIKAGKAAANATLSGWGAVEGVAQKLADGAAKDLISIDELELEGSLKARSGTLSITASVGDAELEHELTVDLSSTAALDLSAFAADVADEIASQAADEGSAVWKALRGKK